MQFKFNYTLNGEKESIIKKYQDLSYAIEGFWQIKTIAELKASEQKVVLVSIEEA